VDWLTLSITTTREDSGGLGSHGSGRAAGRIRIVIVYAAGLTSGGGLIGWLISLLGGSRDQIGCKQSLTCSITEERREVRVTVPEEWKERS